MIIILLTILFFLYFSLLKRRGNIASTFATLLYNTKLVRIFLLLTICLGYLGNFDYNDPWSCLASHSSIFQKYEIYLSAFSLLIVTVAAFVRNNRLKLTLHITETIYWVGKLILFKRNYFSDGVFGMPDDLNLLFDFINLTLRMIIIRNMAFTLRTSFVMLLSCALIVIKWVLLPSPLSLTWEQQIQKKAKQETWYQLQGNWAGKRFYTSADTINPKHSIDSAIVPLLNTIDSKGKFVKTTPVTKIERVSIFVDSNFVKISSEKTEVRYILNLQSNVYGELFEVLPDTAKGDTTLMGRFKTSHKVRKDPVNCAWMYLEKLESDSMVITTGFDLVRYRLKRVRFAQ